MRGLGADVDHDHRGLVGGLGDETVGGEKRALEGVERHLAEQVDHCDPVLHRQADARRGRGQVRRADHPVGPGEVGRKAALPPRPVAERDHVGPGGEDALRDLGSDPSAVSRVFAVDNAEVRAESTQPPGRRVSIARCPGAPKTSPTKRTFNPRAPRLPSLVARCSPPVPDALCAPAPGYHEGRPGNTRTMCQGRELLNQLLRVVVGAPRRARWLPASFV